MTPARGGLLRCPFCRIIRDDPKWVYKHADDIVSFKPFGARHPMHRLFVPHKHVPGAGEDPLLTGACFAAAARWAHGKRKPFKLSVNSGAEAGQTVDHLHVHYIPIDPAP